MASSDHELSINSLTTSISETEDLSYDSKHKINQYIKLRKALERCSNELIHLMIPVLCTCTLTCILVSASCNNQSLQCYEGSKRLKNLIIKVFEKANKKHKHVELSYKGITTLVLMVVAFVIIGSAIMVGMFQFKFRSIIYGHSILSVLVIYTFCTLLFLELISQTMNVALDWFITVFLVFNISVTGWFLN